MNEERRKASSCLQPGTNVRSPGTVGVNNPWSCSSRCDTGKAQAEAPVEEGAWGPLSKCEVVIHQGEVQAWPWLILGGEG